jgi:cytochrome P450
MDIGRFLFYSLLGITSAIIYFVLEVWKKKTYCRLPPGPQGWPIVGNLFQLGKKPHESLFRLATKYGPLMSLSLGMKTTVVVSSPSMAKEVLKTHGHVFAGRIVTQAARSLSHDKSSFLLCQYGSRWRTLRRISNTELFSVKRLDALQDLRRVQVRGMIHQIFENSVKGSGCVNIGHIAFHSAFNLIGNMAFGKDMFDPHFRASEDLKDAISKLMVLHTAPNLADYFPCLQFLDLQGVYRNTGIYRKKAYDVMDKFIEDRLVKRGKNSDKTDDGKKDLLDVLLDMRSDEFTLTDIRGYLNDMFVAGSDTTAVTIEWAIAELVRNPGKLKRAQAELEEVVGLNRRLEESDTERLPYLRAVVKEVFRLHPAGPLLVPHRADSRFEIAGFVIPKHSRVLVNVWGMGRDPQIWNEPLKFVPERFIDDEMCGQVEYRGKHFELIPFGAGTRMCVGLPLASRMVHLVLGSLIHSFEWAPPKGMSAEQMDMTEKFGLALQKAVPLEAIATPRLLSHVY